MPSIQQIAQRYTDKTKWQSRKDNKRPVAFTYNNVKRQINAKLKNKSIFVPRDEEVYDSNTKSYGPAFQYCDDPFLTSQTLNERILGEAFIDHCLLLEIDWTKYIHTDPEDLPIEVARLSLSNDKQLCLKTVFERAVDEVQRAKDHVLMLHSTFRSLSEHIGVREVQDLQIGSKFTRVVDSTEEVEELYGEPMEDRASLPDQNIRISPTRYDGDSRWDAMTNLDYDLLENGGKWLTKEQMPEFGLDFVTVEFTDTFSFEEGREPFRKTRTLYFVERKWFYD